MRCDLARHSRRDFGRIEGQRLGPDLVQPFSDLGQAQVGQHDPEPLGVGELGVALAQEREVGEQLDRVPDIDDDEEGRPAMVRRQRLGVALGLAAGALHGERVGLRPAHAVALAAGSGLVSRKQGQLLERRIRALLGLEDEAAALVEVDAAAAAPAAPDR